MPIKVTLIEERELEIDVDPEEWREGLDEARRTDQMIEIRDSDGRVLAINPQHILYWVQDSDTNSEPETKQRVPA
jgi:hypothetical protein